MSLRDVLSGSITKAPTTPAAGTSSVSLRDIISGELVKGTYTDPAAGFVPKPNPAIAVPGTDQSTAQFPAPNPNPARNPQGYEYETGMAGAGLTPEAAAENAAAEKDSIMDGTWPVNSSTGGPVINFGAAVDTGFKTSEGNPVKSSYGSATDFYNQIAINNILDQTPSGAMTYEAYLSYNGITDPRKDYYRNLDAANEMYARAIGTYGASGEGLAQGNLANAGYSEYLTGLAYANRAQMYGQAAAQMRADNQTYGLRYAQYRQDYDEQQQLLAEQRAAYQAMQQAAAGQATGSGNPSGNGNAGVNIDIGGSGSGAQPSDRSEPSASPTLTSDAQKSAADYLNKNIKTASQLNAAVVALRGQGYSDADIQAAIDYWYAQKEADIKGSIDSLSYLVAGSADGLKQVYGEGDRYEAALKTLQSKNASLIDRAVDEIRKGNTGGQAFQSLMAAAREESATTDKKGNTVYSWDSMKEGDQIRAFQSYIRKMYEQGDISQKTYNDANYKIVGDSIQADLEKTYLISAGTKRLTNVLEDLATVRVNPDSVTAQQYNSLVSIVAQSITVESMTQTSLNMSTPGAGAASTSSDPTKYNLDIKFQIDGKPFSITGASSGESSKKGWFVENGVAYYGTGKVKYRFDTSFGRAFSLTTEQQDALSDVFVQLAKLNPTVKPRTPINWFK